MKNNWINSSNNYFNREVSQQSELLPKGVYNVVQDPQTGELYLNRTADSFKFDYKVYGIETSLIERAVKTWHATTKNLGILLNGVKGTGKTVTAKQIANNLEIPVIVVSAKYNSLATFINSIQQDITVVIDEYEKIYNNYDSNVLTVMDGILDNGNRRMFLLTTNSLYINDNLLQRPGRLRYFKTYEDLTLDVIMEIVADRLVEKQFESETVKFISTLQTITVDIVNAVIDEVNIHKEAPENFKDVFNVQAITNRFAVYTKDEQGKETMDNPNATIEPLKITSKSVNQHFYINAKYVGQIKFVFGDDDFMVEIEEDDDTAEDGTKTTLVRYRVESVERFHKSFLSVVI